MAAELLRVLWVPSFQRTIVVGGTYTAEELTANGLNPETMLDHGEAEYASPKAAPRKGSKK